MSDRFVEEFHPKPTDVAICGSMAHKPQWLQVIERLKTAGLSVSTPDLSENSDWSTFTDEQIIEKKGWLIRRHIANIARAKTVLIANYDKNGIENYIGSNSFLELGVGFVYGKPIYLLNGIPNQDNREEILALEPIVLHGNTEQFIREVKAL